MHELMKRIEKLEYHHRLMVEMCPENGFPFNRLIIRNGLSEKEVKEFFQTCDRLSMKLEKQKAEGFVYNTPLFKEFEDELHAKLKVHEVVEGCLVQNIYPALMKQFQKSL
ncbi:DUF1878 family protein [Rossellomorea vietnamensis]|uniref:DUF1878 family protein n=1 Tax=Rossellomorea vietnamensis TaxID=218284 RepID=A0A0P6WJ64_9BACI|nr:DUF1878 family protein [Rossellomorea vietnamensis]KPL61528.1 hypothetical protein AM506_02570 [Rossellomorea vietnamensis]